jgi:ADP-L-glycero-D-manno-heptose-6-epimerase
MFLVTGGAGFIGSNIVTSLNEAGASDVVVNDILGHDDAKWRNLAKRQIADVVPPAEVMGWLAGRKLDAVIHMGAISDTTASDADLVMENNFRTSLRLLDWCTQTRTPFIYASSAATYGDGTQGFDDDWSVEALRQLKPMNLYGTSKHLFDQLVSDRVRKGEPLPPHWAGLKFFNVFGPNEYHKGKMASVLCNVFDRAAEPLQPAEQTLDRHDFVKIALGDVAPFVAVAERVADRDRMALFLQRGSEIGADKSGTAGDDDHAGLGGWSGAVIGARASVCKFRNR